MRACSAKGWHLIQLEMPSKSLVHYLISGLSVTGIIYSITCMRFCLTVMMAISGNVRALAEDGHEDLKVNFSV